MMEEGKGESVQSSRRSGTTEETTSLAIAIYISFLSALLPSYMYVCTYIHTMYTYITCVCVHDTIICTICLYIIYILYTIL